MKQLITGIILGVLIGGGAAFFLMRHNCQKEESPAMLSSATQPSSAKPRKAAPLPDTSNVLTYINNFRRAYPAKTEVIIHSIESFRLLVNDFDSLVQNKVLDTSSMSGYTWEVGIYPHLNKDGKVDVFFIPTLAHYVKGKPGNSTDPEIYDFVKDYADATTRSTYYKHDFNSVYDFGSLYP